MPESARTRPILPPRNDPRVLGVAMWWERKRWRVNGCHFRRAVIKDTYFGGDGNVWTCMEWNLFRGISAQKTRVFALFGLVSYCHERAGEHWKTNSLFVDIWGAKGVYIKLPQECRFFTAKWLVESCDVNFQNLDPSRDNWTVVSRCHHLKFGSFGWWTTLSVKIGGS